jgi:predicted small lipoprotein YifL
MPPLRTCLILLLAAATLAGCGRRGALQEPGSPDAAIAPAVSEPTLAPGGQGSLLDAQSPGAQEPAEDRPAAAPERPFILDPLI